MYKRFSRFIALLLAVAFMLSLTAAALADYKTIPYGEQSTAVRKMQDALKTKGYYKGAVDGKFGQGTEQSVRDFQANNGLTVDGKAGKRTQEVLYSGNARRKTASTPTARPTAGASGSTGSSGGSSGSSPALSAAFT